MASMISLTASLFCLISIAIFPSFSFAGDPYVFYDFRISYITASPLGIPQRVSFLSFVLLTLLFSFLFFCLGLMKCAVDFWFWRLFLLLIWVSFMSL